MLASFVNRRGLPRRSNSPPTSPTPTAFASSAICSERRTPSASRNRLKSSGGTKKCADPSKNLAVSATSRFVKDSDDLFQEPRTIFQKTIGSWFLVLGSWFLVLGSWSLCMIFSGLIDVIHWLENVFERLQLPRSYGGAKIGRA